MALKFNARRLLLILSLCSSAAAQDPAGIVSKTVEGEEARNFVAKLTLEAESDRRLFQTAGFDQSAKLMLASVQAGTSPYATLDDWANTHRALAGLVELGRLRDNPGNVITYLTFQEALCNALEGDPEKALQTARALLAYELAHSQDQLLLLAHKAIGDDLRRLGRLSESVAEYQEAERLAPEIGTPAAKAAYTEGWYGNLWLDMVNTEIKLPDLEEARGQAQEFQQRAQVGSSLLRAKALLAVAAVELAQGHYSAALDGVRDARALVKDASEKDKDSVDGDAAEVVGTVIQDTISTLDYAEAIETANRIAAEFQGLHFGIESMARTSLLIRRRLAGDLDGVLRELTEELTDARASGNVLAQISALQALAGTYSASFSTDNQIAALEEAAKLARSAQGTGSTPPDIAVEAYLRVLNQLGWAYAEAGQVGKAATTYRELGDQLKAIQRARLRQYADRNVAADALQGQARVLELEGKTGEAREMLERVIDGKLNLAKFNRADFLLQLARLERDSGQAKAAANAYEELIAARNNGRDGNGELAARLEFSRYLLTSSNAQTTVADGLEKARTQLQAASQETEKVNAGYAKWRLEYQYGLLDEAEHANVLAVERYKHAVAKLEKYRDSLSQSEERQSMFGNEVVQDLYQRLIGLLTGLRESAEAWRYQEKFKARSFTEMMGERRVASGSASTGELRELAELEKKILNLQSQLAPENRASLTRTSGDPVRINADLKNLELQYGLARQQASLAGTRAGSELAAEPVSLRSLQTLLPRRTTLLEYGLLKDGISAFVVTRKGANQLHWKLDMGALQKKVCADLRPGLPDASAGSELERTIGEVSRMVLEPVARNLDVSNDHLIIVPSGYLNYIPFEVLRTPNGRMLIDKFTISYLPSASTLRFLAPYKVASGPAVFVGAIGNVSVDGSRPLPGTLLEAEGIVKLEPGANKAVGPEFTHDSARQALLDHAVVHFATHGVLDSEAPLFSALLTSPAEHQPSRLSLYELPGLNLQARLVVLSACQSGTGRVIRGDEVSGFTRTFLLTGAETVVSSLWDISDQSTAELMQGFYRRLTSGQTPAAALRASALAVRKQFPQPKYWAAFVVTGLP